MKGMDRYRKYVVLPAVAGMLLTFAPLHGQAEDHVDLPYDWVMKVETQQLKRQFEYKGSTLNPVEKLEVSWHPTKDENKVTKYEYLYYHEGRPFGMEKLRRLDMAQGEGLAIEIKHKDGDGTEAEKKGAANAAFRLALDAYLNKNPLAAVKVPIASFDVVSNQLISLGFHDAQNEGGNDFNEGAKTDMTIYLYSVPDGKKQTLTR